jgi:cytochrome c-type biogenesis protein CcmE
MASTGLAKHHLTGPKAMITLGVVKMAPQKAKYVRFGVVIAIIVVGVVYLAYSVAQGTGSYYATITELYGMKDDAYAKHLRVSGSVVPGSIHQVGTHADFVMTEQDPKTKENHTLRVSYKGTEPPPDTFKDNSLALVIGRYGQDGVFHADEIQAKCASKYAAQQGAAAGASASKM